MKLVKGGRSLLVSVAAYEDVYVHSTGHSTESVEISDGY